MDMLFLNINYFNMKLNKNIFGFTLIELLVVITIIGILATGWISVYNTQIQKARDSTRVTDVTNLQSAVEQFYQDKAAYPQGGIDWIGTNDSFSVSTILPNLASDPKDWQGCHQSLCGYAYVVANYKWVTNAAYEISTAFENSWNVASKADDTVDGGWDPNRMERWIDTKTLDTSKTATTKWGTSYLAGSDKTAKVNITRNSWVGALKSFQ